MENEIDPIVKIIKDLNEKHLTENQRKIEDTEEIRCLIRYVKNIGYNEGFMGAKELYLK